MKDRVKRRMRKRREKFDRKKRSVHFKKVKKMPRFDHDPCIRRKAAEAREFFKRTGIPDFVKGPNPKRKLRKTRFHPATFFKHFHAPRPSFPPNSYLTPRIATQ